jgi:hypothetical protein
MHHAQPPTRRPSPSTADSEAPPDDVLQALGGVLSSQARIERGWEALKVEHNTYTSTVVHLQRTVDELLLEQKKTTRAMRRLGKLAPTLIAVFEVLRQVAAHYLPGGIHL